MCAAPVAMTAAEGQRTGGDALAAWAGGLAGRRGGVRGRGCLRFAFYGRVSTEDWQDPVTSRARQLAQAVMLVAGRGVIMAEFFDTGRVPDAAVAAASAGRRSGGGARGPGPGVGRDRDRGVRAGVLRQPVRVHGAAVRALRCPIVDAGGRRAGRLAHRGPRGDDARAGPVVKAGDHPGPDQGPHRDGYSDPGAGPLPRRASAVRVPARRRRAAPEQGPRRLGTPGRTSWNPIPRRRRSSPGCSRSGWPGTAPPGSPAL